MINEVQVKGAEELYATLQNAGIDTILDDRDERAGVKFADMELIGIPIRITVGKKVAEGQVELKMRTAEESTLYGTGKVLNVVQEIIKKEMK